MSSTDRRVDREGANSGSSFAGDGSEGPVALGFDVGGTNLRAVVLAEDGSVIRRMRATSPTGRPDQLVDDILAIAEALDPGAPLGVGIAGLVDRDGAVRFSPNLDLYDLALEQRLAARRSGPVAVVNDASAAALGEQRAGAARGKANVVAVTIGTGVGAGIVADGRLLLGSHGLASELGHVIIEPGGPRCACGRDGCLEAVASGNALTRRGQHAGIGDAHDVVTAAQQGNATATAIIGDVAAHLGAALASMVTLLDPQVIVIGGGAGQAVTPWLIPGVQKQLANLVFCASMRTLPDVVAAALGDDAGAVGAAIFIAERTDRRSQ